MDWQAWGAQAINAVVPVVTVLVVFGIRQVAPKLPRFIVPLLAASLGFVVSWAFTYIAGHTFDPVMGALLGAAATWLREVVNTLNEHGTK